MLGEVSLRCLDQGDSAETQRREIPKDDHRIRMEKNTRAL